MPTENETRIFHAAAMLMAGCTTTSVARTFGMDKKHLKTMPTSSVLREFDRLGGREAFMNEYANWGEIEVAKAATRKAGWLVN